MCGLVDHHKGQIYIIIQATKMVENLSTQTKIAVVGLNETPSAETLLYSNIDYFLASLFDLLFLISLLVLLWQR